MNRFRLLLFTMFVLFFFINRSYSQLSFVKKWDYTYGGTAIDVITSVIQTSDHGFIFGGTSYSPLSGNKSEDNWDITCMSSDYWIVKTDSLGIKMSISHELTSHFTGN